MFRTPEEPDEQRYPDQHGVKFPAALDFHELKEKYGSDGETYSREIMKHVDACVEEGLKLTVVDGLSEDHGRIQSEHFEHWETQVRKFQVFGKSHETEIRVETTPVSGAAHKELLGVRHISKVKMNPQVLFDTYNRLNYTDIIDKYTYLVENIETLDIPESHTEKIAWCQVVLTADKMFPIGSKRDFVTFDFVSKEHLMVISRSCHHPDRPDNGPPTWSSMFCCNDKTTYRVPLMYVLRIVPDAENPMEECSVVQFQYSDVAGIAPPIEQSKAVRSFGLENIPKFLTLAGMAAEKNIELGPTSKSYLANPLQPRWRQNPKEMLPGL